MQPEALRRTDVGRNSIAAIPKIKIDCDIEINTYISLTFIIAANNSPDFHKKYELT
jgi:hypothetical protein